ncbi:flagella basal body P-ring formation protein FlgA [Qipengyuania nanhaisediminis]|uniref:flagella basal body P-ring formation protein FlgA n=1 Tax=Qipengyuania nanhaisediminis TaxID=604088 RepID=UPI0038B2842B
MTPTELTSSRESRLLFMAALLTVMPLIAAAASAREGGDSRFTDPAAIDDAVTSFTGSAIGSVGGARVPADRRLRLAACEGPLDVAWHGRARTSVAVACPGPVPWRIFIATRAGEAGPAARPEIARGDPITVQLRGRGFSVQQTGEAMEPGRVGEWIAVRTARDAAPVRAQIERPGLVIIPAP